jgi:arylsulfatase A-like enzyme
MPRYPNILILLLDTARAQNFSCYGYHRPTSPHLDALAAEGVLYENAIAPGCWSLPSQVSLLTGLFPSKHGAHELHLSYAHHYPLLSEVLREAGYATLGVSPNSWMSDEFGVAHGFDTYLKLWQCWPRMPQPPGAATNVLLRQAQKVNRLYSRYVFPQRNRARHVTQHVRRLLATTPEPFFLYAIYWDMHLPYYPYGHYATRWLPPRVDAKRVQQINRNHLTYLTGQTAMTEEDFAVLQALYDGALATIDAEIGALVMLLRQRGILDHTLLIVTSDHGENIGEHGLMSHAYSLHDTLIHVPLIIRYPEGFARGQRVTQQVQLTDLFPTVLDLLQVDRPDVSQELQGVSLLQSPAEERFAYAEMLGPHPSIAALNRRAGLPQETSQPAFDRALRCLRTADAKVIWASDGQYALYDLRRDPAETTNRFDVDTQLAATLLDALLAWQPPTGVPLSASPPELSPDARQRLRDLGYID